MLTTILLIWYAWDIAAMALVAIGNSEIDAGELMINILGGPVAFIRELILWSKKQ